MEQMPDLEAGLLSLFPLVILISSLLLKPDAQKRVKEVFPAVVGLVVGIVYFMATAWPDSMSVVIASIGGLITLATKLYDPISALVELSTSKRLNELTGPGLIGTGDGMVEGD